MPSSRQPTKQQKAEHKKDREPCGSLSFLNKCLGSEGFLWLFVSLSGFEGLEEEGQNVEFFIEHGIYTASSARGAEQLFQATVKHQLRVCSIQHLAVGKTQVNTPTSRLLQ